MIITFTPAQVAELYSDFWDVPYTVTLPDGTELDTSTGSDNIREFPIPLINMEEHLGRTEDEDGNVTEYAIAHPDLTPDDEVVIKAVLDERVSFTESLRRLTPEERSAARSAKRTELRTAARADTRRTARIAQRRSDRQAARQDYRQALRQDARIAERLAAAQKEREAAEAERVVG